MSKGWRRTGRTDRGLTLVELAVAIFVLAIGTVAALRGADQAQAGLEGSRARLLAGIAAQNRVAELQLLGPFAELPRNSRVGGRTFTLDTGIETTRGGLVKATVTARGPDGAGAQRVVWLVPAGPASP